MDASHQVLHMLGDNHIHRVYVCECGRVKGVITPTDILRWVATGDVPAKSAFPNPAGFIPSNPVAVA